MKSYTISEETMTIIYNTLRSYGNMHTYQGERTGGVLAGCPRGPKPSAKELIVYANIALRRLEKELDETGQR